ncbi:hypothetical protein E5720_07780 [Rhodococcus sp. PAMC28707]|uniref:TetR/AcrR family transcriptional regulator C-terminal ligand-binding domain-containing protein n=1 Tax=unclassified Rhodococcus (in: high G+C Gram-positive bacteria) TaxID=192944 RepID=UPI00109E1BBA|nr:MULTISPECIES: TetR/AcrR family transcriptional regulator C-terminal ligand-binding domain-containing protein [unclassified Rhodococcus (in: high G+C Gram-positive bacteria)]QCB49883.1 hypothetical protein E5769_06235 [Rhodococcus sp. PAMC28705]QCB58424.1 hypothetical protein E5720_07780 [Rhodococcus sp. PAMC28707]
MTSDEPRTQRVRSGGRSEVVRTTVAATVLEMLREGNTTFSGADVAQRANIHRSTVYRWWPTRVALVEEALTLHTALLVAPDTGSWVTDVQALTREFANFFANPVEIALNAVLASDVDSEVAEIQRAHWNPILRDLSEMVARAKARGEVGEDVNARFVLQMIVGPLLLSTTFGKKPATSATVEAIAEATARAFAPTP